MIKSTRKAISEYKVLILDMDGTLYYQLPLRIGMAFSLAVYYALHFWRIKELFLLKKYRRFREAGKLSESEALIDTQTKQIFQFWIYEYPLKYVKIFRDRELIDWINFRKENGVMIIVYSDYFAGDKINATGLNSDYSFCGTDTEINCLKPDSRGLKNILKTVNVSPQECLFIGDRYEKDGLCAGGAGVDYVILDSNPLLRYMRIHRKEIRNDNKKQIQKR